MVRTGKVGSTLTLVASLLLASTAYGDEAVTRRIAKHGKVGAGDANRIASVVSIRMKRAADMTNTQDPLRVAVSQALFGQAVPVDQMGAAKVRLRLYAGLNEWALDSIFSPKPGLIASCVGAFGLSSKDCEALVAAAARTTRADAARRAGGGMQPARSQPQYGYAPQPTYAQPAAPSRFGRYDSGFRGQPQQPQPAYGYAQPARPTWQPSTAVRPQQPAAARPMVAAPPPNPQLAANRKAEYERKRQEYLERKKAEMEARKAKVVATAGGTDRVQRGPSSEAEADATGVGLAAEGKPAAPAGKPAKGAVAKAPSAPPAADEPAEPAEEGPKKPPALDNEFLDGLLGDPLGKK